MLLAAHGWVYCEIGKSDPYIKKLMMSVTYDSLCTVWAIIGF